ncbi:MAG: pentapeptide repeat-containing protein, partial [Zetaproteobacteria bacterium]|nr:pentapeptide repeat-containing protein [Zetaproteobacteria bacterium]
MLRNFLPCLVLCGFASVGQAVTSAEQWVADLSAWQQRQPENLALQQLHAQVQAFRTAYQQATAGAVASSSTVTLHDCIVCQEEAERSSLQMSCEHTICESCHLSYVEVHKGTPAALECWEAKCGGQVSLVSLGAYLGRHQREDLYVATLRDLIQRADVGAEFCPHCGDSLTLHSQEEGYGATCAQCDKTSCFACGKPAHGEIPCAQLEDAQANLLLTIREIVLGGQAHLFGLCPHCYILTEHKDGCDAMTCGQNAADKGAIRFKGNLQAQVTGRRQTRRGTAGCGQAFPWHNRITIQDYLEQHDPEWKERHQEEIDAAQSRQAEHPDRVMGQRLTRAELDARIAAGQSIEGADLRGVNLEGLEIRTLRFPYCQLDNEQVRYLLLHGGSIEGANLQRIMDLDLAGIPLRSVSFVRTRLTGTQVQTFYNAGYRDFGHAYLGGVNLSWADLRGAHLMAAYLVGADLTGADLQGVDFTNATLTDANLRGANLEGANLRAVTLMGANLWGANLPRINLTNNLLHEVCLVGANLRGANLRDASLRGISVWNANLSGADLRGVSFHRANLRGTNLEGANLRRANLRG